MQKVTLDLTDGEALSIIRGTILRGTVIDKLTEAMEDSRPEIAHLVAREELAGDLNAKFRKSPKAKAIYNRYSSARRIITKMRDELDNLEQNDIQQEFQKVLDRNNLTEFVATGYGFKRKEDICQTLANLKK